MGEIDDGSGIGRRDVLRRGAALGGALTWATPLVQTIDMRSAWAQGAAAGTPRNQSSVGLCYRCDGGDVCCVTFLLDAAGVPTACEPGDVVVAGCSSAGLDAVEGCGNCALFSVSSADGGRTVEVLVVPTAAASCVITSGVGRCAGPPDGTGGATCVAGDVGFGGRRIVFALCGADETSP